MSSHALSTPPAHYTCSTLDRMRLISSSIVLRDSQPVAESKFCDPNGGVCKPKTVGLLVRRLQIFDGIPSPDGRHLLVNPVSVSSNVWIMENF